MSSGSQSTPDGSVAGRYSEDGLLRHPAVIHVIPGPMRVPPDSSISSACLMDKQAIPVGASSQGRFGECCRNATAGKALSRLRAVTVRKQYKPYEPQKLPP